MPIPNLRTVLAAAIVAAAPAAACAQTFDFTYTGLPTIVGGEEGVLGATGTGSFTVDGSGDATAFVFNLSQATIYGTDDFSFGLNDLISFQASVTNGQLTSLSLFTDQQTAQYDINTGFNVQDLSPGDSYSYDFDTGPLTFGSLVFDQASCLSLPRSPSSAPACWAWSQRAVAVQPEGAAGDLGGWRVRQPLFPNLVLRVPSQTHLF